MSTGRKFKTSRQLEREVAELVVKAEASHVVNFLHSQQPRLQKQLVQN